MEAALFFINVGLMVLLCNSIRKSDKADPASTDLGLFSYREERGDQS